jgi:hypothetical protein
MYRWTFALSKRCVKQAVINLDIAACSSGTVTLVMAGATMNKLSISGARSRVFVRSTRTHRTSIVFTTPTIGAQLSSPFSFDSLESHLPISFLKVSQHLPFVLLQIGLKILVFRVPELLVQALDTSFHILHSGKMDVPHPVQCLPGHVSFRSTMRPVEQILLGQTFAPSLVGNLEKGFVVSEDLRVRFEDYETAVQIVGTKLIFVLLFRWRKIMVDSCSVLAPNSNSRLARRSTYLALL